MMLLAYLSTLVPLEPTDGRIVAASLFKNGYAVVVREADLGPDHKVSIRPPTNAVLGTLWISASKDVKIERAQTESLETKSERNATNLDELIQANFEKNVTLWTIQGTATTPTMIKGRLISVTGSIVVVEGEGEIRSAIQKSSIVSVYAEKQDLNFRLPSTSRETVITVTAKGTGKIYLVSLQRGMTWAPAYQLDVTDEKVATLTAKATILNDLAPLVNVDVNLVTGFPNMKFLNIMDPLSSGYTVDQFIQSIAMPVTEGAYRRESMMQNQSGGAGGFRGGDFAEMTPTGSGQQLEDLFFYKQPDVSLKPGERGYFAIFSSKSDYSQEYSVDIPDTDWNSPRPAFGAAEDAPLDVWHTIKFKNTAGQPLTTGPVVTIKNGEVMGQDMMMYTSAGSEASVKVTKALDVRAEAAEEEIARERGALKFENRAVYDKVTVKGTIEITNNKPKAVQLRVVKATTGEASDVVNGDIKKTPAGLRQVNPVSHILWKPKLEPGKSIRLEYKVVLFVPTPGY